MFGTLLGIAIVGRLGCVEGVRLLIRSMSLICVLSVIWALALPEIGVHQATDKVQGVHDGLWRGVFSHKITLGTTAGLTFGLLLFFGRRSFSNPFSYLAALVASAACVVFSGSATGLVTTVTIIVLLFASHHVAVQGELVRGPLIRIAAVSFILIAILMFSGLLDRLVTLFGRSSDMTGRAYYWPHIIAFVNQGNALLGYGYSQFDHIGDAIAYAAGMKLGEAHNGLLEMLVAFGYLGVSIVVAVYTRLLWSSAQHLRRVTPFGAKLCAFPFAFIVVLIVSSYAESIILGYRGVWTVLLAVAVSLSARMAEILSHSPNHNSTNAGVQAQHVAT